MLTARFGERLARIKPKTAFRSRGLTHLIDSSVLEFGFRDLFSVWILVFGVSSRAFH